MGTSIRKNKLFYSMLLFGLPFVMSSSTYAATAINLNHLPVSSLKTLQPATLTNVKPAITFQEIKRSVDEKNILHIRVQQKYLGYSVRGGEFIIHQPLTTFNHKNFSLQNIINNFHQKNSMTGKIYKDIEKDLNAGNLIPPNEKQAQQVFNHVLGLAVNDYAVNQHANLQDKKNELIIYIDKHHQAHWAYKIT